MIIFHIFLLGSAMAIFVIAFCRGRTRPQFEARRLVLAALPFLMLGLLSRLLLTIDGRPQMEWLLPLFVAVMLTAFLRPGRLYRASWLALFCIAILLSCNYLALLSIAGYTGDPARTVGFNAATNLARMKAAHFKTTTLAFSDRDVPRKLVEELIGASDLTRCTRLSVSPEWHTSFTGLYRVHREPMVLVFAGGRLPPDLETLFWSEESDR